MLLVPFLQVGICAWSVYVGCVCVLCICVYVYVCVYVCMCMCVCVCVCVKILCLMDAFYASLLNNLVFVPFVPGSFAFMRWGTRRPGRVRCCRPVRQAL
jgi:hypothetical protein